MSSPAAIHLGTQGWAYPDWIGVFYPPRSKQEDYLPFYARVFDTVELDTTFYHPPKAAIARSWAKRVPENFRFAAKVPRHITHDAGLVGCSGELAEFVQSLDPLGEKLGPLLVQLPAEFRRDPERSRALSEFLSAAPSRVKMAVEFRDASWHAQETYDLLRERGAALAWTAWRELPSAPVVTADFLYVRWLGVREWVGKYDRVTVDRGPDHDVWERELERALPQVREVFGYFNNHWAGHSPASANEMKRRLGLVATEPRALWDQPELW